MRLMVIPPIIYLLVISGCSTSKHVFGAAPVQPGAKQEERAPISQSAPTSASDSASVTMSDMAPAPSNAPSAGGAPPPSPQRIPRIHGSKARHFSLKRRPPPRGNPFNKPPAQQASLTPIQKT